MQRAHSARRPGRTFFFTITTYRRQALLTRPGAVAMLHDSLEEVRSRQPLSLRAWVVLPDHGHFIWTLPDGDNDYTGRWSGIKEGFARRLITRISSLSTSPGTHPAGRLERVWQRRLLGHRIRDAADFASHLDYLHYNPVKHGLTDRVSEWRFSSFHTYVERGVYGKNWGGTVLLNDTGWQHQGHQPQSL